jgi:hypothetical protein
MGNEFGANATYPRVPLLGGCSGNCTIETQRVVGLAWRGGIVVGSLWCGGIVVRKSQRTTNPTTPTTSQRKAHHTGTAHDKSHDKSHDNPTTLRQSFGCLRDHGGPKVRTFRGPLTSCRSTIYTDPPTLVATPTLNPTNSHHLDAPAASGQTSPSRRPSTDIETAMRKSMHTSTKYHINSLLSGSVTLPPWRINFVTFHQVAK